MLSVITTAILALITIQGRVSASAIPLLEAMRLEEPTQEDNSLSPNAGVDFQQEMKHFVDIITSPPSVVRRIPGSAIELECVFQGFPSPVVHWLRDNVPITDPEDLKDNAILEGGSTAMAKGGSRLIINDILPKEKTTYTCVAQAGTSTAYRSTTVFTPGSFLKPHNITEYIAMNKEILNAATKPRITFYYTTVLSGVGSTIVLPCKVSGKPHPDVYWIDNEGAIIKQHDARKKVMPSGELIIHGLRWRDMGGFSCVARNALAEDTVEIFVYPFLNEN